MSTVFSMLDRKLMRDLWRLKGQAMAIGIIVACGVAILVMALGAFASLNESRRAYYERYRFADVFANARRAPETVVAQLREIEGLRTVETRIVRMAILEIEGMTDPANAQFASLPERGEPAALNRTLLYRGRYPDPQRPDEAVASKAFMDAHGFKPGDSVTAIINGKRRQLEIVGVADSPEFIYVIGPGALMPDDERFGIFWMSREALEAAYDLDGAFNEVSMTLSAHANERHVIDAIDDVLDPFGGLGAYGREDQLSNAFIESEMEQLKVIASIIPPVFLVVSAMLLNAILKRLVATERQEIGLLKAFGFTDFRIALHYMRFSLAITLIGVVGGYVLGMWLAHSMTNLYAQTFRFPLLVYRVESSAFIISGVSAMAAGAIGSMNAAMGAARLAPAEAMSPAPPASYSRGWVEKLSAHMHLDELTRMILRHITRWPGRAMVTVAGAAAAMALLVASMFSFDSIDEMIDSFFFRSDPYDASISFFEPQPGGALNEIRNLPGVMMAEPNRQFVARLKKGHLEERVYVVGLDPDAQLRQLLDQNDTKMTLPPQGLIMSQQRAANLKVGLGDRVRLEVLEGRRPVVDLHVAGMTNDYIGAVLYVDRAYANTILMEEDSISGVYIRLDDAYAEDFKKAALDLPMVQSVSLQGASVDAFEENIEEVIGNMMMIYTLIGGAIAFGVTYNSMRISLTERGREMASLRVLGFTPDETAYLLLGEQALLILLAIPLGAFLGFGLAWSIATAMTSDLFRIPMRLNPSTYGFAAIVVVISAALSAILIRRRIDNLDLISVLKTRE